MKIFLAGLISLLLSANAFAQRFSQYNTGTLYDSFENPSQKSFTPDTSRMFASNFLLPNFNANFYLAGDAQAALKSRAFSSYYNTADLQIGKGKYNHINANANAYLVMFKVFSSLNGDQELGFSINTKSEARGLISDESIAVLNGSGSFANNSYDNIFNDNTFYQVYQQIGFSYREQVSKKFALGFKISALSGVTYNKLEIDKSHVDFDKANDSANFYFSGRNYESGNQGRSLAQNLLPNFRNPGASISIGTSLITRDGFTLQGNIKDLGFIHWNSTSSIYVFNNFNSTNLATAKGLSTPQRENNVYNALHNLSVETPITTSFTSATNGLLELSASKSYWLDYDKQFKFAPTFIASKELFYSGFTGALVAPVQYHNYSITLTSSYNDLNLFTFGGQFMIKSANAEFFIGSERLYQTGVIIADALRKSTAPVTAVTPVNSFTGADFFIGFSVKFGQVIEHPMNASSIPINQEKGFLGRFFERLFPSDAIKNN